jgi:hypothetical protein
MMLRVGVARMGDGARVVFMAGARTYTFRVQARDIIGGRNGEVSTGLLRVRLVSEDGPLSVVVIPATVGEYEVAVPCEALVPDDRALGWGLLAFVVVVVVLVGWALHALGG